MNSSIIVATDANYGIGLNNKLPWKNKVDMKFFRDTTQHSVCIMGRKTYESIKIYVKDDPIVPLLANRICIVVSSIPFARSPYNRDVIFHDSLYDAFVSAIPYDRNIFFIGGNKIFESCLPYINKIHLNMLQDVYNCDTFFPQHILQNFDIEKTTQLDNKLLSFEYIKKDKL